jgi:hypothetical protein
MPEPMSEEQVRTCELLFDGLVGEEEPILKGAGLQLVAEVRRRGERIKELEIFMAGELWRMAMRSGTPEQVEKLTTFLIERGAEDLMEGSGAGSGRRGPGEKQEGPPVNRGEASDSTVGDQDEPSRPE